MKRIVNALKKYGLIWLIVIFFKKFFYRIFRFFSKIDDKYIEREKNKKKNKQYDFIKKKAHSKKYKYVFVFYPYTEWNLPVFQRPQQIALSLTTKRDDILYFFCTANGSLDTFEGLYEEINDNLYVIKDYDFLCNLDIKNRVVHFYSTDIVSKYDEFLKAIDRNDKVLYEYIDEIHESITGSCTKEYLNKHKKAMKNEDIYVVATADKLLNDTKKVRKSKYVLSTNGVNIEDFDKDDAVMPDDLAKIRKKYKKVICYYGSLAVWFDYDLIKECAKKYPNYAFLLIGMEYDSSLKDSNVLDYKNVIYLGKRKYSELYNYTKNVDLLTIPFLINEITESTSPVKLFEYMATRIPILTTAMKECKKYKSVIVGENHEDYIKKIDEVIALGNNKEYLDSEYQEALDNTWEEKANVIVDLLDSE